MVEMDFYQIVQLWESLLTSWSYSDGSLEETRPVTYIQGKVKVTSDLRRQDGRQEVQLANHVTIILISADSDFPS